MSLCPIYNSEVTFKNNCAKCKNCGCNKMLIAIFDTCNNIDEIFSLDKKIENALRGREAIIITNRRFDSAAEAIANAHHFEFVYSWQANCEFGEIPQMFAEHPNAVAVFTNLEECKRFVNVMNGVKKKYKIQVKLWKS